MVLWFTILYKFVGEAYIESRLDVIAFLYMVPFLYMAPLYTVVNKHMIKQHLRQP